MEATTASLPTPAPMGRRERNKQQTRTNILAAAAVLFARDGVAESTIDQIAELADVSDTTVYNYFTSKDGLVDAYLGEMSGANSLASQLASRPAHEAPVRALRGLFEDLEGTDALSDQNLQQRLAIVNRAREDKLLWGAFLRTTADAVARLHLAFAERAPEWERGEALMAAHACLAVLQAVLDVQDDASTFESWRAGCVAALERLEHAFPARKTRR